MTLSHLLDRQPGLQLDFVAGLRADAILETIVAFANSEGGQVVIGVDAHGQIQAGLQAEDADRIVQMALTQVRPPLRVDVAPYELLQGVVLVLSVMRSGDLHSLADGRVLARRGAENVVQTGAELTILAAGRTGGAFELEPVPGTSIEDFDPEVVAEYVESRRNRQPRAFVGSTEALMHQVAALTDEGQATVGGLLLFGRDPQARLPQSGLTFVKFAGADLRGEQGIGYGRREDIIGPAARIIERTWQVVFEEMAKQSIVRGLVRAQETEYPVTAVREALVNAVAHRDYRITGRRIEVIMHRDRLEVTSPGGLPGYITVQNILDEHYSRNPRLVNGLFQWGLIEELGLGVNKMFEAMAKEGHPMPEIRATPYAVTVILRKGHEVGQQAISQPKWEPNMNERQMLALQFVQQHGRITNSDYRQLCPNVSPETLRLDFSDLVDKGLLLKIGDKKGTHYVLKRKVSG